MKAHRKSSHHIFSSRWKILIPATIMSLVMGLCIGFSVYNRASGEMIKMGAAEAKLLGEMAARQVDVEKHKTLSAGSESSTEYQDIVDSLNNVKDGTDILFMFTFADMNGTPSYVVDTDDSDEKCPIGMEFSGEDTEAIQNALEGTEYVADFIDNTEWGHLITVYVPVKDSAGKVAFVLGTDYDAGDLYQALVNLKILVALITCGFVLLMVIFLFLLTGKITRNIKTVDGKIYDLVNSDGDLTQKLVIQTNDETEDIADHVNDLLEYIRTVVTNITFSSETLHQSVEASFHNVESTSTGINEVFGEMEQMSASMEETSASLNQIEQIMSNMLDTVLTMNATSNDGANLAEDIQKAAQKIKEEAITEKENVKSQVEKMSGVLNERIDKSKAVEEIGKLTEEILSVSDQTNLLALNASIEAARAGEAGKGFVVVAEEVTKLAADSGKLAEEIRKISEVVITAVNDLSTESQNMLTFVEDKTLHGYDQLVDVGEKYEGDSDKISSMMLDFRNKFNEFENDMTEVKESMSAVNIAVDESTKAIVNVTETSERLSGNTTEVKDDVTKNMDIAEKLQQEANKFKV